MTALVEQITKAIQDAPKLLGEIDARTAAYAVVEVLPTVEALRAELDASDGERHRLALENVNLSARNDAVRALLDDWAPDDSAAGLMKDRLYAALDGDKDA